MQEYERNNAQKGKQSLTDRVYVCVMLTQVSLNRLPPNTTEWEIMQKFGMIEQHEFNSYIILYGCAFNNPHNFHLIPPVSLIKR